MEPVNEDHDYLTRQIITYIGNKRALLDFIGTGIEIVRKKLNKPRIASFDVFSGSGIVSRYLKRYSDRLVVNDVENYARTISQCYLANRHEIDWLEIDHWHEYLTSQLHEEHLHGGFITELYAPKNIESIGQNERCFYTPRNARYLDTARGLLERIPEHVRPFFIAPLLAEASVHANTSGVFKGFYKNSATGTGQFGGNNRDALLRILGRIVIRKPVLSRFESRVEIHRGDANRIAETVGEVDLAYLDPPYNQHPYGSNYFMLNLIVDYVRPTAISRVSGIPTDWYRSAYNKKQQAGMAMRELVRTLQAKFLLVSFNSEGFIPRDEMVDLLREVGATRVLETRYNAFRGSRNLAGRDPHVREYLYLVEKA